MALGWAAPAHAQLAYDAESMEIALGRSQATTRLVVGVRLLEDARAAHAPMSRPGDLRKQEWWVETHLEPWLVRRTALNRVAMACFYPVYQGVGMHGGIAQEATAHVFEDFARVLLSVRARPSSPDVARLFASVVDAPIQESVRRALVAYDRCVRTADGLDVGWLRDRCRDRANQLEADTTSALGAGWRPPPGADPHTRF